MMEKRERNVVVFVVLALMVFLVFNNFDLSGNASKNLNYYNQLNENEYNLFVGDSVFVGNKRVTLISIADSSEAIVDVSGIQKSVNQYGIRVINDVQVQNMAVGFDHVVLKLISLESTQASCTDTDDGDIYLKGDCSDRFYEDKPITDFCDFSTLKEYTCGYDTIIDEVHCLKHTVKCVDGCVNGACKSG